MPPFGSGESPSGLLKSMGLFNFVVSVVVAVMGMFYSAHAQIRVSMEDNSLGLSNSELVQVRLLPGHCTYTKAQHVH